jgi:MoaA/NifB/PqqE/SkfB family radical SAM enzyme
MEDNKPTISRKAVQHGLEREDTGKLQTLWVELPGRCNQFCPYCYANGGEKLDTENLLKWDDYEKLLEKAKEIGVDSIGIPGAGEPFFGQNKELTMQFLNKCAALDMYVTLFTTGEFIDEELADELRELPVEVMLKCNSLNPWKQDEFVSNPARGLIKHGYGEKRNQAIDLLIRKGFNDPEESQRRFGRESRMALVTSIMTSEDGKLSNVEDMAEIQRLCRKENIILDVDSVLKRGRGANCDLCIEEQELKKALLDLQREDRETYGVVYEISQSYIGTTCDRYKHHMYVNQYGEIRPCIGAMDVNLGNVKSGESALEQAWDSSEMQIIRDRGKRMGKCAECGNYKEGLCNSCIGRRVKELTNETLLRDGAIDTIGCWNFRSTEKNTEAEAEVTPETELIQEQNNPCGECNKECRFR